jgi:hypothetical protein
MSARQVNARPAKPPKALVRDQSEIVRMAAAEAANRAAERRELIETAAYFRAQKRGFEPGHELEDWFAAETEIAHAQQLETAWQP